MNNLTLAAQTIKDTISAQDVGNAIGLEIRHGRCQCPMHGGHDFNCVLYKGNRGWYCHVCKQGGDVLSFVQQYYKIGFKDSIAWFNDTFRMGLDLNSSITPEKRRQAEKALQMRKNAIEHKEWMDRMQFNMALAADDIVRKMENTRDETQPKTYGEEWNKAFCDAVTLLPEAQKFADDCMMDCMKEVQN